MKTHEAQVVEFESFMPVESGRRELVIRRTVYWHDGARVSHELPVVYTGRFFREIADSDDPGIEGITVYMPENFTPMKLIEVI